MGVGIWDVWRPVIVAEMNRKGLSPRKLQDVQPDLPYRTVYQCLYKGRGDVPSVPNVATLNLILLAIGKTWSWLERQGKKAETN